MLDYRVEVMAMTANRAEHADYPVEVDAESLSLDELARRKGVRPVRSLEEMARPEVFGSDEELAEFLAYTAAKRHADLA
jgi:hypothetical protein